MKYQIPELIKGKTPLEWENLTGLPFYKIEFYIRHSDQIILTKDYISFIFNKRKLRAIFERKSSQFLF